VKASPLAARKGFSTREGAVASATEQVEAGQALLRALAGIGVSYVFAHRQSSGK
jgi:hypothetical protein